MDDVRAVMEAVGSRARGADGCVRRRADVQPVRHDLSGADARPGDDRHLRASALWAPDYPWAPTRAGRERFIERSAAAGAARWASRSARRAGPRDPAFREWWSTYLRHGRQPRRGADADADERRDRRAARAARRPRAHAGPAPHRRSLPARSRKAATSPPRFPAPPSSSCPATITCRLSATRTRCSRRSSRS